MITSIKTHVPELVAAIAAAIGLVVYIVNATTGYMAGQGVNALLIGCTVVALAGLAVRIIAQNRMPAVAADALLVIPEVLLIVSFAQFVLAHVRLAADIYFIPVNYPASEQTALNVAIVGVVFYLVAIIALIAKAFTAKDESWSALLVDTVR